MDLMVKIIKYAFIFLIYALKIVRCIFKAKKKKEWGFFFGTITNICPTYNTGTEEMLLLRVFKARVNLNILLTTEETKSY